jgi:hypothetical protein
VVFRFFGMFGGRLAEERDGFLQAPFALGLQAALKQSLRGLRRARGERPLDPFPGPACAVSTVSVFREHSGEKSARLQPGWSTFCHPSPMLNPTARIGAEEPPVA